MQSLLMGGQACILYGAAEFSRDTDIAVLLSNDNLERLSAALDELRAQVIAVPPFAPAYLERGHRVHFRCARPDVDGMRIDIMARMRGVEPFPLLWERRTMFSLPDLGDVDVMSLADLVAAKKTQGDMDWPMVRRLLEVHYFAHRTSPNEERVNFWLRELRTAALLVECAAAHPGEARRAAMEREAVAHAVSAHLPAVEASLVAEEAREREADRVYWAPLRAELAVLRRDARNGGETL